MKPPGGFHCFAQSFLEILGNLHSCKVFPFGGLEVFTPGASTQRLGPSGALLSISFL